MNRLRLVALWIAVAFGLLTGCQSTNCNGGNGGFLSRLTSRRGTVVYDGPVLATPVSSMPYGNYCEGGPMLEAMPPYAPGTVAPPNGGGTIPPTPPGTMLPSPTPGPVPSTGPPPLAPVPQNNSLATPTPAQPSLRRR